MTRTSKGKSMRTTMLQGSAVLALSMMGLLSGCGSDLTCGSGTTEKGEKCVAAASGMAADGGLVDSAPKFDGVTSLAPSSDSALQITWDPALDDVSDPAELVYKIYVATATGEQNFGQPTAVSAPGARSHVVANLQPDTEYFVVARAVDTAGNEDANSVELSATPATDSEPPTFGGAMAADSASSNSVEVIWEPATDDLTPTEGISYTVRWSDQGGAAAVLGTIGVLTPPGATSALIANLPEPLTAYHFFVQARDAAGNVDTNENTIEGETGPDVDAPRFAGCTSVAEPGATRANVAWLPASDDTTSVVEMTYNVYAFTEPVDADTPFGAPQGTFTGGEMGIVEGLLPSTEYFMVCRAMDQSGNEDQNITFRQVTTRADSDPPDFGGIAGVVPDSTTADLTWSAATDPNDQTPTEQIVYLVYQSTEPDPFTTGQLISPGPVPGATNFTVRDLTSRTQYYWGVRASDGAANVDGNTKTAAAITLVSFANDVQPIFTASCAKTNCHLGEEAMQGMRLESGYAYSMLVNQPTVWQTETNPHFGSRLDRVEPGDLSRSFLWHKLYYTSDVQGSDIVDGQPVNWSFGLGMPKDIFPQKLDDASLETIEAWITQGAREN